MGYRTLCLSLLLLVAGSYAQQCTLITPRSLRVETKETIVVDAEGHNSAFDADISILDFPQKKLTLATTKVSLNNNNGFLGSGTVTIPSDGLPKETRNNQFVYVSVRSGSCTLEKVVMLQDSQSNIFIQTDKTIYTPGSKVMYRVFSMDYKKQNSKQMAIEFVDPAGAIVSKDSIVPDNKRAILSKTYDLPESLSFGIWTISVKYEDNPHQNYTTNFEVKEYVLPTIEVLLKPEISFFWTGAETFFVNIEARYLFGKPVEGHAFVLFGLQKDGVKTGIPESIARVQVNEGEGLAELKREHIRKYFSTEDMLHYKLYVQVSVVTATGNDMAEAQLEEIYIVTSPYKIIFIKPPQYFHPGLIFNATVFVTNPDGSPAHRIPVVANPGDIHGETGADGTTRLPLLTDLKIKQIPITVKTNLKWLPPQHQATATMVDTAYSAATGYKNYLHISIDNSEKNLLIATFYINSNPPDTQKQILHFTYLIMSRGRIIKVGRQERLPNQLFVSMSLPITEDYLPSFRIVAYYMVTTNGRREIVSDSVWVDVAKTCTLEVTGLRDWDNKVQKPSAFVQLKLRADHKAKVGLVIVDKGVFMLNNKYKLTQSKVWNSIEKSDIAYTPSSGADSVGVFYDSGLALQTSFGISTNDRAGPAKLKRRSVTVLMETEAAKDEEDYTYILDSDIEIRSDFPESWYWREVDMIENPDLFSISTKVLNVQLKDSATTWEVLAVSWSQTKGLCVAPPYEITAMKKFFIDLQLPYSVVRNEQVEIRAIIYNYESNRIKVRVTFSYNNKFCSLSTAKKNFRQEVWVGASSSVVVPFVIVPLTTGYHDVEVTASVYSSFTSDGVRKKLKVVPEGELLSKTLSPVVLEPELKGRDGVQEVQIEAVSARDIVPTSDITIKVILRGAPVSQLLENAIDGHKLHRLIQLPRGSGEQNMITMTTNVITTRYLDATGQWEPVGPGKREKVINNIRDGYRKQLVFRKLDLSFAAFKNRPSSTWLTAYVAKVFAMSKEYTYIDDKVLCGAIKWLILERQMDNGMFIEKGPVIHMEMVGGNKAGAADPDTTLTAFVLISLLETREICSPHQSSLGESIDRATNFLTSKYSQLHKPYSIAITSYALALAGKLQDTQILLSAATDKRQWKDPDSLLITLEATSYALLTLLKLKEHDPTNAIVRWINEQKYYGERYSSTQATIIMFQALAQFQLYVNSLNMDVSVYLPDRNPPVAVRIYNNAAMSHSVETNKNQNFVVKAEGKGKALLTVVYVYHSLQTDKQMKCKNFDLSVKVKEERNVKLPDGVVAQVSIEVCARYLKDSDATMSIIEISMMTGFSPDMDSLNKLMRGEDKYISTYELNKGANDRGTLILYLDKISHTEPECVKLYANQYFRLGLVQPASVTVYEYYTPENRCTKFYHVDESSAQYGKICQGDVCHCAEGNCFMQLQNVHDELTAYKRIQMACATGVDYVFKAAIKEVQHRDSYDNYVMTIVKAIKQGTDEVHQGEDRDFLIHIKCLKDLDLKVGTDYLILGGTQDLFYKSDGYSYIIGKNTWIEWWPNEKECQYRENQEICDQLDEISDYLEFHGCPH